MGNPEDSLISSYPPPPLWIKNEEFLSYSSYLIFNLHQIFFKIISRWSMYDKTDAPHTMGDWLSILLIYDTKLGIIQKPDVMDRQGFQIWNPEHEIKKKSVKWSQYFLAVDQWNSFFSANLCCKDCICMASLQCGFYYELKDYYYL